MRDQSISREKRVPIARSKTYVSISLVPVWVQKHWMGPWFGMEQLAWNSSHWSRTRWPSALCLASAPWGWWCLWQSRRRWMLACHSDPSGPTHTHGGSGRGLQRHPPVPICRAHKMIHILHFPPNLQLLHVNHNPFPSLLVPGWHVYCTCVSTTLFSWLPSFCHLLFTKSSYHLHKS